MQNKFKSHLHMAIKNRQEVLQMDIRKRIENLFEKQELIGLTFKERQELRKLLEMKQEGK